MPKSSIPQILAAADIGSNTAHLLVAQYDNGKLTRLSDLNEWLSLGEIVTKTGHIPPDTEALLIKTCEAFKRLSRLHQAEGLYIFATEAMRKASNGADVLAKLAKIGTPVDLIDGRREAEYGLAGAWIDGQVDAKRILMVEVGGGSVQVAFADGQGAELPKINDERSLPLGTGALIARLGITQPATNIQVKELKTLVRAELEPAFSGKQTPDAIVGVGGVARGVWRSLHPDGDPFLRYEEIEYLIWAAQRLTNEQIANRFNVKLRRASTLLPGAILYRTILECAGQDQIRVSRFGVREGAILEMAKGRLKPARP